MNHFQYKADELFVEDVALQEIAAKVGTPVYVYSHATLERHFLAFDTAFAAVPHTICYSVKANSTQSVLKTFINLGSGVDIVSGGELFRAVAHGRDLWIGFHDRAHLLHQRVGVGVRELAVIVERGSKLVPRRHQRLLGGLLLLVLIVLPARVLGLQASL